MSSLPAVPVDYQTGLEDFQSDRVVVPRLTIDHKSAPPAFVDSLTGDVYPEKLTVIILGLVRQRILWHVRPGDKGELPLCKSTDADNGYPTDDELLPKDKSFPWEASGFNPADYVPGENDEPIVLPCANCGLQKWGSHPLGKKPYCSEMYTFPVLFTPNNADEDTFVPALLSIRSTGMKPANAYLTRFATTKTPLYTSFTTVRLDTVTRSGNTFAVPAFQMGERTKQTDWPEYAQMYRGVRDAIRQPPGARFDEDDTVVVSGASVPTAPAAPAAAPAAPKPASAPASAPAAPPSAATPASDAIDDDELPF